MRVFQVPVDYDHPSARALFSYLRLGALTDVSCLCADKDGAVAVQVGPVGLDNENAALGELAAACRLRLQQFDTSIEEDEALLGDQALPRKLHNAVRVRLDEKLVLNYYLDLTTAAMAMRRGTVWPIRFASYSRHVMPLLEAPQIANRE
jgi:hypothetical protein